MKYNINRTKLAITNCIIIGDYRRLKDEDGPLEPIRNVRRLAIELERLFPDVYNCDTMVQRLRKAETQGLSKIERRFIFDLTEVLRVTKEELYGV